MSFFSTGFSSMLNERRLKEAAKKKGNSGKAADSIGKAATKEEKKDEGRWDRLTDAYGRTYWQHSVTGEWSYGVGGGLVSPVLAVNPSPVLVYPGAVFTPSPVFAPTPPPPPAKEMDENKKDENKKQGKGWWETVYDDHGNRYWEHTVTKKTTYKDPYF